MTQQKALELKSLLSDPIYNPLTEYLNKIALELKNIDEVRELSDPVDQAVELKACKKAYYKVQEILNSIITIKALEVPAAKEGNDHGIDESQVEK